MTNIEKIVADYETCKKASTIGLHLKTIFHWIDITPHMEEGRQAVYCIDEIFPNFHSIQSSEEEKNSFIVDTGFEEYTCLSLSAPTAEEVPLPEQIYYNDRHFKCMTWFGLKATGYENFNDNLDFIAFSHNPNEATARLQMAIWLCENVEEAKRWYVNNKFLVENNNEN